MMQKHVGTNKKILTYCNMTVLRVHNVAVRKVNTMITAKPFEPFYKLLLRSHLVISSRFIQNQESCRKESVLQGSIPKTLAMVKHRRSHRQLQLSRNKVN